MQLQVKVTDIFPVENRPYTNGQGQPGVFTSRKVWAVDESNPTYPEHLEFTFTGRAIDYPSAVDVGDTVMIDCALSGRKYIKEGKESVFMSIRAWGISRVGGVVTGTINPTPSAPSPSYTPPATGTPADDLPF